MGTPPTNLLEQIFAEAKDLPPSKRTAWLDAACSGQAELRAKVEELLRSYQATGFMKAMAASPEIDAEFARLKPEDAGDRIGNYKLLEQIGEGGFGTIWVAEQEAPVRRRVALKIIKLGMDTKEVVARFEQERQALAMMDHPNIAKVLDAGATPLGRPFFVMELVRGIKITDYCDQAKLSTGDRLTLFIAVCHAVQHAHQKGIIHRDLKPSNILVTLHDGTAVPKVIDFGVAKATQQQRLTDLTIYTQFEQMIGTPVYMSPEQAEMSGLDIDTRSDIYSLGVLLYELLTGCTPFDPEDLVKRGIHEIRRAIREQEPQKPSTTLQTMAFEARTTAAQHRQTEAAKLLNQVRGDLDWIVMKALEKDRSRRYETATELAKDIGRHLADEAVYARPPSRIYRMRRMVSRNRLVCAAGAAVFCSMALGLAVSFWQVTRAETAAIRASTAERDTLATLRELRETAPDFATHARMLADKEKFPEAVAKLDYAIKLRSDVVDYVLTKANLLQCQFQFQEAARTYRKAASLEPGNPRALSNAAFCDELAAEVTSRSRLSRESLVRLSVHMANESRSPAEMLHIGRLLGLEKDFILDAWRERLKQLPLTPDLLANRLEIGSDGLLSLDLSGTAVSDLSPLEGMPLARLDLNQCRNIADLRPLRGVPLRSLHLFNTKVTTLNPLSEIRTLVELDLGHTKISDLRPLRGLPLERLEINGTGVVDLAPLEGMSLRHLTIADTRIGDLSALKGSPLVSFDCESTPVRNCDALADTPMTSLNMSLTEIGDLSFLRGMPLRALNLHGCRKVKSIQVLLQLTQLETLRLPDTMFNFSRDDLLAIGQLRHHPSLRNVGIGHDMRQRTPSGQVEGFWATWENNSRCVLRLREAGIPFQAELEYDGSISVRISGGDLTDLSILEGARISALDLICPKLTDLKQLARLPLQVLRIRHVRNVDLALFANLELETLLVSHAESVNIAPLRSRPLCDSLEEIYLENLTLTDFSPIGACSALKLFSATGSPIQNLEPIRGSQLNYLFLGRTHVDDLSPISAMPLREIYFDGSRVTDVSPLLTCPMLQAIILPRSAENTNVLRGLPHLRRISYEFDSKIGGPSETVTEFWGRTKTTDKLEIPLRDAKAKSTLVDLSTHYNADFTGNWHGDILENDLSSLPIGIQNLAGTEFDCRGIIQVRNAGAGLASYPVSAPPIRIDRRFKAIHLLHGCIRGDEVHDTEIAQLKVRFVDGSVQAMPILFGRDVLDWWKGQYESEPVGPKLAWVGSNGKSRRRGQEIRLFKSVWQNSHPTLEVESLEFVSSMSRAAPFLIAITIDP